MPASQRTTSPSTGGAGSAHAATRRLAVLGGRLLLAAGLTGGVAGAAMAQAGDFPNRPVRIVVGWTPGGLADIATRTVAEQLSKQWKQPVIVDNRPGASGTLASDQVARTTPDGYTLLSIMPDHVVLPAVRDNLNYHPIESFVPVSQFGVAPLLVMAPPSFGVKTMDELVALAKSKPGTITYSTPGAASLHHLSQALLNAQLGIDMVHVPYKGGAPAMMDAMAGIVNLTLGSTPQSMTHVKSGKLLALGITSTQRSPLFPDVPTLAETVAPGFSTGLWVGIVAPAGTPQAIADKVSADIRTALNQPEVRERLNAQAFNVVASSPAEFKTFMQEETARWGKVVKDASIKAN